MFGEEKQSKTGLMQRIAGVCAALVAVCALCLAVQVTPVFAAESSFMGVQEDNPTKAAPAQVQEAAEEEEVYNPEFDEFIHSLTVAYLQDNYSYADQFLADPESYGVDMSAITPTWGIELGEEYYADCYAATLDTLDELQAFDYASLSPQQQDIYDTLNRSLGLGLLLYSPRFAYYEQVIQDGSGLQADIYLTLCLSSIESEEDIEETIAYVLDVYPTFDYIIDYLYEQGERGTLLANSESVIESCNTLGSEESVAELEAIYYESIDALGLDEELASSYKERLHNAFVESFIPAYALLAEEFQNLEDLGLVNHGTYANLPYGKEYYELNWRVQTGSDMTVEEGKAILVSVLLEAVLDYLNYGADALEEDLPDLGFESYEEMLEALIEMSASEYPLIEGLEYEIGSLDPEIMGSSVVGLYILGTIDDRSVNAIYVQEGDEDTLNDVDTFLTIAHEGYPGHMYHYAYVREYVCPEMIILTNTLSIVEGYAKYVEIHAVDSFDNLTFAQKREAIDLLIADVCIGALTDIAVNYDGWTVTGAVSQLLDDWGLGKYIRMLQACGIDIGIEWLTEPFDRLLIDSFGHIQLLYAPYAMGYIQLEAMRVEAAATLGDKFDVKEFNTAVLNSGFSSFDVIQRNVDAYVASAMAVPDQPPALALLLGDEDSEFDQAA